MAGQTYYVIAIVLTLGTLVFHAGVQYNRLQAVTKLRHDLSELMASLPHNYVTRNEFNLLNNTLNEIHKDVREIRNNGRHKI